MTQVLLERFPISLAEPQEPANDYKHAPLVGSLVVEKLSPRDECLLSDVDDLARHRNGDGPGYDPLAVEEIKQNLVTAVKEGAMPDAVSTVKQRWEASSTGRGGIIRSLGRTAVETAMRGRLFYQHAESLAVCEEDINYAKHLQENLRPKVAQVMISPRMTRKDGSLEVAKAEGLADTDAIWVNWLDLDEKEAPQAAMTSAILVADVPIDAWVSMLADAGNIFGKAIPVVDPESALSVMRTFSKLEIPVEKLAEGPVSILAAVLPYIKDPAVYQKVAQQLSRFRGNQDELHTRALSPAERWLQFNKAEQQSLEAGLANAEIQAFIEGLSSKWGPADRALIENHKIILDGKARYFMTRPLAAVLQNANRNFIFTAAAVVTGNAKVLAQMSNTVARQIYENEMALQIALRAGIVSSSGSGNNNLIAGQNIKVGGGCNGENIAKFQDDKETASIDKLDTENNKNPESDYHFDNYMHCVKCQPEPKKGEAKKMCGPCGICKACDKDIRAKAKND